MTLAPPERPPTTSAQARAQQHQWAILAVLCLAVFVTVMDSTIVNVALPSIGEELRASTRQLQWIVDAYSLVFAGLLLAAGTLGDRYGRRLVLLIGLGVFAATSIGSGLAGSTAVLIGGRALMGVGAALIFPATLAILTNVFQNPSDRAKAIGVWSATTGVAVAAGPITGGWLLEHFWWGSVFFVNIFIVAVAIAAVVAIVPESKDEHAAHLDIVGLGLSIAAVTALIFTIIEAPEWGWLSLTALVGFAVSALLMFFFVAWELRVAEPMLPVRIFRNLRFSAASVSVTAAFFSLFGFIFLITQYFQLVLRYSPLQAGLRTIPVAAAIAAGSVVGPLIVKRFGTKLVVAGGLFLMSIGFAWVSTASASTPYIEIVGQMILLGLGLGFTTAPATESIMGSLSVDKAGVGSAVNDTTRELGGTLGVAVIGSVFSSIYISSLQKSQLVSALPPQAQAAAESSVIGAGAVARQLGANAAPFLNEVNNAFLSGLSVACLVVAGVAGAGALFALKFLPARAAKDAVDRSATLLSQPA
jgi:EmrB/QacA subfamily drug resistance transporter